MTSLSSLPSGPLRLSTSSKPINTFSLKYPASHPSDLSTAGAALSSTASGDISLRIAPGAHPGEARGRRWAGKTTRPTGDVECAIVWDPTQNCWTLHRIDNVVQLAHDDPQPLPRKPTTTIPAATRAAPLALPKPARPAPPPPVISQVSREPSAVVNQPIIISSSSVPSSSKADSKSSQPTPPNHQRELSGRSMATDPSTSRQSSLDSSSSKSAADQHHGLALPLKKTVQPLSHLPQTTAHRITNHSTTSTISSPGDQGPIRVVQAEEIEEFDFADSSPDRAPLQPIIAASPLTLPSPGVGQGSRSGHSHPHTNFSPVGRPSLSRSPSLVETGTACSPLARPNASQGLALPTRSAGHRATAPSPAYQINGIAPRSSAAVAHNQPTAPSPLQSVAYSSSSSPTDPVQGAPTPPVVGISPASLNAGTTSSATALRAPLNRPVPGQSPAWQQYNHHLQHASNPASPHHLSNRSPAPLTNQNLSQQTGSMPTRTYHRSDSGSSVRESDSSSDEESSEEEVEEVEPINSVVPLPTVVASSHPTVGTGAVPNSEDDAEADEDDEEDDAEFENMATELEASMLIRDYYGPGAEEPKGLEETVPATVVVAPKAKATKKKGTGTGNKSGGGGHRKTSAAGAGNGKSGGGGGGGKGKSKEKGKN
ncbi:uncharacterized protein MELLADRAFT_93263 [Melampsora larici-populina 98AG31]|uniref:Transcription elongation factor Eaf N-terminal domain-containing protein n=1 Tax=Melampsora larici-populina (strain 98AG31 / pathotype 3-4-7) TaxID=747676 RepID=F4S4J8_MELLP|nr:uncharacterized protein MELLADRAFT_93263 [Melampsora larici-populina 98AG31]EGG00425.1 hypothetical protein MELLADRAFT_93263 [Melampsora larici-populina 98AG31]